MPFSTILTAHPAIQRLLQIRRRPILCYGIALALVALATVLRWGLGPDIGLPFITYFPAVTITALLAGLWPAVLATGLSVATATRLFTGQYTWSAGDPVFLTSLFFVVMAAIIIAVVALLNRAVDQLSEQERNIRNLVEAVPTGIVVVEHDGRIQLVNASAEAIFGYTRQELLGRNVDSLLPKRLAANHKDYRTAYNRNPETRPMGLGRELSGLRKNGSEFDAEIGLSPFMRDTRKFTLATVIDVSERRRAQEREKILARELQHRTQNLFSVIQVLATRSLSEGRSIAEAKDDFNGRLRALAIANRALSRGVWVGAPLREIITAELSGFPSNVDVIGCDIDVNAEAAQQFALIVHELATNAVKHGALSVPEGRVVIRGEIRSSDGGRTFVFRWTESGGLRSYRLRGAGSAASSSRRRRSHSRTGRRSISCATASDTNFTSRSPDLRRTSPATASGRLCRRIPRTLPTRRACITRKISWVLPSQTTVIKARTDASPCSWVQDAEQPDFGQLRGQGGFGRQTNLMLPKTPPPDLT